MVYSMHTNFDEGENGMNDALASALGLIDVKPLLGNGMARGGFLPSAMKISDFAAYAVEKLDAKYGLLVSGRKRRSKVSGPHWRRRLTLMEECDGRRL